MKLFTGILAVLCGINVLLGVFSHLFVISDFSAGFIQRMTADTAGALVGFFYFGVCCLSLLRLRDRRRRGPHHKGSSVFFSLIRNGRRPNEAAAINKIRMAVCPKDRFSKRETGSPRRGIMETIPFVLADD